MNILNDLTMKGLRAFVSDARSVAEQDARRGHARLSSSRWIRSRGTFLTTGNANGQCEPRPAAECPEWRGTKREIEELIALVAEKYPEVDTIRIEGGYDSSDTFENLYYNESYEPMDSWWEVVVWTRE